jgi:hypothetical protein
MVANLTLYSFYSFKRNPLDFDRQILSVRDRAAGVVPAQIALSKPAHGASNMELKRNPVARRPFVRPVIGGRVTIISGGGNGANHPSRMPKTAAEGLAGCLIYPRHNLDSSLTRRTVTAALTPVFWALVPAPTSVSISQAWPGAPNWAPPARRGHSRQRGEQHHRRCGAPKS